MFIHIMIMIKHMQNYKSNYDKFPATYIEDGVLFSGWNNILDELISKADNMIICIETYHGVHKDQLINNFKNIPHALFIDSSEYFKPENEVRGMTENFMRDDALFGYMSNLKIEDYLDNEKVEKARKQIASSEKSGNIIVFGYGSSLVANPDILIYADMPQTDGGASANPVYEIAPAPHPAVGRYPFPEAGQRLPLSGWTQ